MLILQYKQGAVPPQSSPVIPDDPLVNDDFRIRDLYIKDDGTKMWITGYKTPGTDQGYVHQWSMSTPWDVSTMTHDGASYVLVTTTQERWPAAIDFKPDGTQMYIAGGHNGKAHMYTLSTPWDLSTATHTASSPTALAGSVNGMVIKPDDGSRMFIISPHTSDEIEEHVMSTHWDVTSMTGTPVGVSTTIGDTISQPSGLYIRDNGTWWYTSGYVSDNLSQNLSSFGYAPSTIAAALATLDTTAQTTSPFGIFWKPDGSQLYIGDGNADGTIIQYSVGSNWMLASANL